jgi:ribonuclease HI
VRTWTPPEFGSLKINVDGAFQQATGEAAIGVIIRDHDGDPKLLAWRVLFNCQDVEEAEAIACLEGIRLSSRWPQMEIVVETDCASVVEKANMKQADRSLISAVIHDIITEGGQRQSFRIYKGSREQNVVAHSLAQLAIRSRRSVVSFSFVPECVQKYVMLDRLAARSGGPPPVS